MGKLYPKIVIGKDGSPWWQRNRFTFDKIPKEHPDYNVFFNSVPYPKIESATPQNIIQEVFIKILESSCTTETTGLVCAQCGQELSIPKIET